jgi:hypothetical protein
MLFLIQCLDPKPGLELVSPWPGDGSKSKIETVDTPVPQLVLPFDYFPTITENPTLSLCSNLTSLETSHFPECLCIVVRRELTPSLSPHFYCPSHQLFSIPTTCHLSLSEYMILFKHLLLFSYCCI